MPGLEDWDLNLEPDQQTLARRLSFSDADSAEPLRASRPLERGRRSSSRRDHAAPRLPVLPPIEEGASEGEEEAETPVHPSHRAAPPSVPSVTPSSTLYLAQGDMPHPTSAPVHPSQCAAPPSVPVTPSSTMYRRRARRRTRTPRPSTRRSVPMTFSSAPYPAQGEMSRPTSPPVATSLPLVIAPPAPLQSQQLQQEADAVETTSEYQRQLQATMQQQALAEAMRARAQVQQLRLYTVAGSPAGYETKWSELHPSSQSLLLSIEEKLGEYKYQSQQLDQCSCLYNPSSHNKSFELDARQIMQVVGSTSTIMDREMVSIKGLTDVVKEMMWNADIAIHSYVKLRTKFVQRGAGGAAGCANGLGSSGGYTEFSKRPTKAPTFCCYIGAPRRPSPFIQLTVARFEEQIGECFKCIEELEQHFHMRDDKSFPESLEGLSKVLSNMHDFFIHVASKVENTHQAVEAMKIQYLNDLRCWGDWNDPFVEADKRESAKQEATVRMVHPTLHLSPPSQRTTWENGSKTHFTS